MTSAQFWRLLPLGKAEADREERGGEESHVENPLHRRLEQHRGDVDRVGATKLNWKGNNGNKKGVLGVEWGRGRVGKHQAKYIKFYI